MIKRRAWKQVKGKEFKVIKAILFAGLPIQKVCDVTERSWATVAIIKEASDMEDYRKRVRARSEKSSTPTVKKEVKQTNGETDMRTLITEAVEREKQMVSLLTNIDANLMHMLSK